MSIKHKIYEKEVYHMNNELFWKASSDDLKRGFTFKKQEKIYICLLCGKIFEQGVIFSVDNLLLDAKKAVEAHVKNQHLSLFEFYLGLGRVYTGLSSGQAEVARLIYAGYSDKEIVATTEANSASTIRNQRFSIREKYKQAKILVALVEMMEEKMEQLKHKGEALVDFHPTATQIDERFAITQKENEEIVSRYFDADGKLLIKAFPAKEKRKIIILQKIVQDFEKGCQYTEKEVNKALQAYYDDYVTIRRYLIQYGFMDRDKEGKAYWVK